MDVETREILFSFDQPATVLPSLLITVQQALTQQKTRAGKSVPLYDNHRIVIIDAQQERATYLVQVLSLAGYHSLSVANSLEAFTLFLQKSFIPLLIILGQDDPAKRFFLQRLLLQMLQKFDVEIPIVRLITHPSIGKLGRAASLPQRQNPFTPAPISVPLSPIFEPFAPPQPAQHSFASPSAENVVSPLLTTQKIANNTTLSTSQVSLSGLQTSPLQPASVVLNKQKISLVGQSLGRYQIESLSGEGPSSDVYLVYDRLRENRVALKAIQTNITPSFTSTLTAEEEHIFQREATLMTRLKHSHIVPVLNTGKTYVSGSSFMYKTMPFYAERSLTQWLYEYGGHKNYAPHEVLPLIMQLADALQYAHDQQVLFLNFKPGNILVKEAVKSIDKAELALTDFSLAQDGGSHTYSPETFPYIAPERWEGYVQPASDQYALAVLAYELLSGRALFQGTTEQIMRRLHLTMQAQSPSLFNHALSVQASEVILRALAKKPEERFASVGLFAQNLQRFCS
jgi:hypothetical protein